MHKLSTLRKPHVKNRFTPKKKRDLQTSYIHPIHHAFVNICHVAILLYPSPPFYTHYYMYITLLLRVCASPLHRIPLYPCLHYAAFSPLLQPSPRSYSSLYTIYCCHLYYYWYSIYLRLLIPYFPCTPLYAVRAYFRPFPPTSDICVF